MSGKTLQIHTRTHTELRFVDVFSADCPTHLHRIRIHSDCAKLSKIKLYDIRDMNSQGGVKSTETVCVKDNLSSIVENTHAHTHFSSLVLHHSGTHTEITFPPAVENEVVYQQPVIQIAHLQTHTHTLYLNISSGL